MTRRGWLGVAGVVGGVGVVGSVLYRAVRSEEEARLAVAGERTLAVREGVYDAVLPGGFETVATPADFRAAAGRFVAAGNALLEYKGDGTLAGQWRCGLELPPAALTAMVEAGDGVWVGTDGEGVVGWREGVIRQVRPGEAKYRKVRALLALASGGLLWGTAGAGVLRWEGKELTALHPSLAGAEVTALAGREEDLYIGTRNAGLWRFHAGQLDKFGEAEGLPDLHVQALAAQEDVVVVGTALGAALFRAGRFERKLAEGFFVRSAAVDGTTLYAGTLEDGLVTTPLAGRGRPTVTRRQEIRQVISPTRVLTRQALLAVEGGREETLFAAPGGVLSDGNVSALAMDGTGRLWVGYFDRGLDVLGGDGAVTHFETDRLFCINRIVHSANGTAVATANGLVYFDGSGKPRQVLTKADGLLATHVTDVLVGETTVVATPAGVTLLDRSGARSVNAFHGLVNNHVYALAARGKDLFAGTLGGITRMEQGMPRVSYSTNNSGLRTNWVSALVTVGEDLYVGTYGGGVQRFDGNGGWHEYRDLPRDVVVNPGAMVATAQGVYAGTLAHGLLFHDLAGLRWQAITRGLPSLNVTALAVANGHIYAGTENGLVKITESVLKV